MIGKKRIEAFGIDTNTILLPLFDATLDLILHSFYNCFKTQPI